MKNLNVHLEEKEHHQFKLACVQDGRDMAEVVRKLIREYLRKREKSRKK